MNKKFFGKIFKKYLTNKKPFDILIIAEGQKQIKISGGFTNEGL